MMTTTMMMLLMMMTITVIIIIIIIKFIVRLPIFFFVTAPETKAEKDHTGAIVGGVLGGLAFIVLVVLGIWWCSKKNAKNTGRVSPESPPLNQASDC